MASYEVHRRAVMHARKLIDAHQYVLDSDRGDAQPSVDDETKARFGFVYGDSVVSIERASSRVSTAPPSGGTRKSSSPLTTYCGPRIACEPEPGS